LRNHPDDHGKLFGMTTYQSSFSRNQNNDMLSQTMRERDLREKAAGAAREDERRIGGRI